jgi:hypothetical protein
MRKTLLLAAAATLVLGGCGTAPPTDLLEARAALVEARAASLERQAVLERGAVGMRLNDVLVRGFPAGPPGRLRFTVDVPKDGRFQALVAIDPRYHQRPGVEFVVKVRRDKREEVAFSLLVDPIAHDEHRGFVPVDVDLGRYAGKGRELVLETRGYEETGEPVQAFWGTPAITAAQRAPLAILYLVDTLRADHTGVYGYKRNTTPELDAFAKDAIVFEAAVAHASWTKPSEASILTSHRPASTARCSCATRSIPAGDDRRSPGRAGRDRRGDRQPVITARVGLRPRLRLLAGLQTTTRAASWWAPTWWWTRRSHSCARGAGCRPFSTCTRWTRTSPTRRPRPSTACSSRTRARSIRRAIRAATTRSRSTSSGWWRNTTATSPSAITSSAASCAS